MNLSPLPAILTLLGGMLSGGGDLLDSIPSEAFWAARDIPMTVDAMQKQLQPTTSDLTTDLRLIGAEDPDVRQNAGLRIADLGRSALTRLRTVLQGNDPVAAASARLLITSIEKSSKTADIRRLMAIRALGELKDAKALATLNAFVDSREPFVSDYAFAAISHLANRPASQPVAPADDMPLHLLPKACRAVLQLKLPRLTGSIESALEAALPRAGQRQLLEESLISQLAPLADALGNVRLRALTIGLVGDVATKDSVLIVIATGEYDSENLRLYLAAQKCLERKVAGLSAFEVGQDMLLVAPSDRQLILLASPGAEKLPMEDLSAALAHPKAAIPPGPLFDAVQQTDRTQPIWAIAALTDADRAAFNLDGADWLTLASKATADGLDLRLTASGKDPVAASNSIRPLQKALQTLAADAPADSPPGVIARQLGATLKGSATRTGYELTVTILADDLFKVAEHLVSPP